MELKRINNVGKNIIIGILVLLLLGITIFFILTRIELARKERDFARFTSDVNERTIRLIAESIDNQSTIGSLESDRDEREEIIRSLEIDKRKRQEAYNAIRKERDQLAERIERAKEISQQELKIIQGL